MRRKNHFTGGVISALSIFILLATFCIAENYTQTGSINENFNSGSGIISNAVDVDFYTRSVSDPQFMPLVQDLDRDGTSEIIVIGSDTIYLYNNIQLNPIESIDIGSSSLSPPVIVNLDGDEYIEIVIFDAVSELIKFVEYNGTDFYVEQSHSVGAMIDRNSVRGVIGCNNDKRCMLVVESNSFSVGEITSIAFNFSEAGGYADNYQTSTDRNFCFPYISYVLSHDLDQDGDEEFYTSIIRVNDNGLGTEQLHIFEYEVNDSLNISFSVHYSVNLPDFYLGAGLASCATSNAGRYVTEPVGLDAVAGGDDELVFGLMTSTTTFRIHVVKSDGSLHDTHPEILQADGILVSNPIIMNAFVDTGAIDYCIMGYDQPENEMDLLCGSQQTGKTPETMEFRYTTNYNVTNDHNTWHDITHATQASAETTDGANLDEIINSYGIFSLRTPQNDDADLLCNSISDCDLIQYWGNDKDDTVAYALDYEGIGLADIIMLDDTNIWYADDGYTNIGCDNENCITEYQINPCIPNTWKINTTAEIQLEVTDDNGYNIPPDYVTGRACLYYGSTNEQCSNWAGNTSSGTTFAFSDLAVNKSIVGGVILLQARETGNYNQIEEIELIFNVGLNGVEFGDCTTIREEEEEDISTETVAGNNSIQGAMDYATENTGLGSDIIIIIVLLIVTIGMLAMFKDSGGLSHDQLTMSIGITIFVDMAISLIAVLMGYIGSGTFITMMILLLLPIAGMVGKIFFGSGGG